MAKKQADKPTKTKLKELENVRKGLAKMLESPTKPVVDPSAKGGMYKPGISQVPRTEAERAADRKKLEQLDATIAAMKAELAGD